MNVALARCAPSGRAPHWDQVDWDRCQRHARRLPVRIVKATRVKPRGTGSAHAGLGNGLSRVSGKLSCTVLRGGGGGNAASLPDQRSQDPARPCAALTPAARQVLTKLTQHMIFKMLKYK